MRTPSAPKAKAGRAPGVSRRGILGGIGAGGLAAAGVVFGRPSAAYAVVHVACCKVCFEPSVSIAGCRVYRGHYIWSCRQADRLNCLCCETMGNGCPRGVRSAVSCYYG